MRDLSLLKREALLGLSDPWYFSTEILGNGQGDEFPRPEREIRPMLEFYCRPRPKELVPTEKWFDYVSFPRETAKTVNVLVLITLEIIKNPNTCVMIMNEEKQQAAASLGVVARWLESEKVVQLYGKFRGGTGWEKEYLYVSQRTRATIRDPTLYTAGVQGPLEGWHPNLIVFDDLIGRDSAHREGFRRATARVEQSIPVLKTGGRAIYICTRWGPEDPSADILAKWKAKVMWHAMGGRGFFGAYAVPEDKAIFPYAVPGEPLFPSILSREALERHQKGMPWPLFASQYLNEPQPEGGAYFDESDFQHFELYAA